MGKCGNSAKFSIIQSSSTVPLRKFYLIRLERIKCDRHEIISGIEQFHGGTGNFEATTKPRFGATNTFEGGEYGSFF